MKEAKAVKAEYNNTEYLSNLIVELIQDKKGKDIISLNLQKIPEAAAEYFIVCHADSTTQVKAIADYIEHELKDKFEIKNIYVEGKENGEWVLVEIGGVIVHVFQTEKREFYQLEDLWNDASIKKYETD